MLLRMSKMDPLVGRYSLSETFAIDVRFDDGALQIQATGQSAIGLDAISPTEFRVQGVAATLTFELGPDGHATRLTLHQNGHDMPGERDAVTGPTP